MHPVARASTAAILLAVVACGCVRTPTANSKLLNLGMPERHAMNSVWLAPLENGHFAPSPDATGEVFVRTWVALIDGAQDPLQVVGAVLVGWAPALVVAGTYAVVAPAVGQVVYSTGTGAIAIVAESGRLVFVDTPRFIAHRLHSHPTRVRNDIRDFVRVWNGPGLRPNRVTAVRGSGDMILAYNRRLRRATGESLGISPAEWITYYEKHYGRWKWELPVVYTPKSVRRPKPVRRPRNDYPNAKSYGLDSRKARRLMNP